MPGAERSPYAALAAYLEARAATDERRVTLTFATLERAILGGPLPLSAIAAGSAPRWWHARGQVHAWEGWLRVGWQVEAVDLAGATVTFVRGDG